MAGLSLGSNASFLKQSAAQFIEPLLALAQALEQSNIREVCQIGFLGSHHRLTQRKPAAQMHQQHPQVILIGFVLAQTFHGPGSLRELFPIARQK